MSTMKALLKDERGTETLEWGLVCGLLVIGAIAAIAADRAEGHHDVE